MIECSILIGHAGRSILIRLGHSEGLTLTLPGHKGSVTPTDRPIIPEVEVESSEDAADKATLRPAKHEQGELMDELGHCDDSIGAG